jgi:myo-inositol-1(or 4)-monophosphatase
MKLNPWDTAAGVVILEEAGGKLTNYDGKPYSIYSKKLIASNRLIHQQILDVVRATRSENE